MGKLIAIVLMMLLMAVSVPAQEQTQTEVEAVTPQLDAEGQLKEVRSLQEQIKVLIKARGDDQKAIGELKAALQTVAGRIPAPDAKVQQVAAKESLKDSCKTYGLKFDRLDVHLGDKNTRTLTIVCK